MNRSIRLVICLLPLLTLSTGSFAATLEHDSRPGNNYAKALFRFWCPDDLAAVRGVVVLVPGSNGDGRGMVSDADWQKFACQHQLALVGCWFQDMPHEKYKFIEGYALASKGSGQALLDALNAFAATSQHDEVASVPLVLWGQSAGGQFNYEFTCWKPERVLAFVVNKGGIYYTHLAPEAARRVPGIFFIGENDLEFRKMSLYGIYAVNRRATCAVDARGRAEGRTRGRQNAGVSPGFLRRGLAVATANAERPGADGSPGGGRLDRQAEVLRDSQGENAGRRMVHLAPLGTSRTRLVDLREGPVAGSPVRTRSSVQPQRNAGHSGAKHFFRMPPRIGKPCSLACAAFATVPQRCRASIEVIHLGNDLPMVARWRVRQADLAGHALPPPLLRLRIGGHLGHVGRKVVTYNAANATIITGGTGIRDRMGFITDRELAALRQQFDRSRP